jgi:2-keto-4-pentenoate hydratase
MTIHTAADRLRQAARTKTPCEPVRDLIGRDDVSTAYAVQKMIVGERVMAGGRMVGRKIGLTSPAVQQQLGVDRPDFGVLFADMEVANGGVVPEGVLLQPKVEAEVAFILGRDLDGAIEDATVREAVEFVVPALEIVDSRIADWDISFGDTVADNASSGLFVLGDERLPLAKVEPADVQMTLRLDGEEVSQGSGRACLGDPLRAGQVVLSGALGPMVAVTSGARVDTDISGLGRVAVTFG